MMYSMMVAPGAMPPACCMSRALSKHASELGSNGDPPSTGTRTVLGTASFSCPKYLAMSLSRKSQDIRTAIVRPWPFSAWYAGKS